MSLAIFLLSLEIRGFILETFPQALPRAACCHVTRVTPLWGRKCWDSLVMALRGWYSLET